MTVWSPQQNEALSLVATWMRTTYAPFFYLGGYAGTGKTTLAIHLASFAKGKVLFGAFTGKAARVMRSKGCAGASTIHSMIYHTETNEETGEVSVTKKSRLELPEDTSLIIIDECSMVDEELGRDLLSFGIPVLVLGDPAQLPPIKGGGFFTGGQPDYMLTEVHRQAAGSPIIRLATEIREGGRPRPISADGLTICWKDDLDPRAVTGADIVIVGRNDTRIKYNERLRMRAGRKDTFPEVGEPLICLRNDREKRIFNGDIMTTVKTQVMRNKKVKLWVQAEERKPIMVDVRKEFFSNDVEAAKLPYKDLRGTQQFTYGYAITCHKSQGSQWRDVCVFDESFIAGDDRHRWLYTAITRAAENLTLVIGTSRKGASS